MTHVPPADPKGSNIFSKLHCMEESIEVPPTHQSIWEVEVEQIHVHTGLLTGVVKIQLVLIPLTKV